MSRSKTLYLANDYGFSKLGKAGPLLGLVEELSKLGADVWEPFERNNQIDFSAKGWAYHVGQADFADVRNSDGTFAIVNGCPPDEGVMIELGMAIALKKAVFLFRDDFRRSTDSEDYPLNLMLFTGFPEKNWEDYYYTSIDEIADPNKALVKWLQS
ncbi:MAG: nucleoside 2-deoxyribosyltransferase [Gammaproteobacteria bacterium]|nr:nucleoside 2-deoxyribosyltransferase [Gammaproteobacteria bacterium]